VSLHDISYRQHHLSFDRSVATEQLRPWSVPLKDIGRRPAASENSTVTMPLTSGGTLSGFSQILLQLAENMARFLDSVGLRKKRYYLTTTYISEVQLKTDQRQLKETDALFEYSSAACDVCD